MQRQWWWTGGQCSYARDFWACASPGLGLGATQARHMHALVFIMTRGTLIPCLLVAVVLLYSREGVTSIALIIHTTLRRR